MKILKSEYWRYRFWDKKNNRYNGVLFEDLVEIILKKGFADDWKRTKSSHDNAHDLFSKRENGIEKWAECKIRSKNLATFDISKTLVMAINHNIDQILVFSYSPLIASAIMHLSDFANRTKKKILVIDDENLERLIIKHVNDKDLKKFFPAFDSKLELQALSDLVINRIISSDLGLSLYQFKNYDEDRNRDITASTNIGKYYLYELYFSSNLDIESDMIVDFANFYANQSNYNVVDIINLNSYLKDNKEWNLLPSDQSNSAHTYRRKVQPYEVFNIRLYFQPISDTSALPVVNLKYNGNDYSSSPINIRVIKTIATPEFIGGKLMEQLDEIDNCHTELNKLQVYLISGNSGVGKSRFKSEVIGRVLKCNYNIYSISGSADNRMSSFSYFLKELLSLIFKIPVPNIADKDINSIFTTDKSNLHTDDKVWYIIMQCLRNQAITYAEIEDHILPLIIGEFTRTKAILLIDDVQYLDKNSINLLEKLSELDGICEQCSIFYIYNTETLDYKSAAGYFYQELLSKKTIAINDFSEELVEQFINSAIRTHEDKPFSDIYKQLYNSIVKSIPHRPFYLHQFVSELDERKIVKWQGDHMYIDNHEQLGSLLRNLSVKDITILDIRIGNLSPIHLAVIEIFKYLGNIDSNIMNSIPSKIIKPEIIAELIRWNYLKEEDGRLSFVHSLMEKYVLSEDLSITGSYKRKIKSFFNDETIKTQHPLAVFAFTHSDHLFYNALDEIMKNCNITSRNAFYANLILKYIETNKDVSPDIYVCYIDKLAVLSSENNKLHYISKLDLFYKKLHKYIPVGEMQVREYIKLISEYGSYLTVYNKFSQSVMVLREGIVRLDNLNLTDEKLYFELKSRLINRIGVAYKQCRKLPEALTESLLALEYANKSNSTLMQALSYIDLGYISFGAKSKKEELLNYWHKAAALYEKYNRESSNNPDVDTNFACQHINALLTGIKGDYNEAAKLASKLKYNAISKTSAFYELQGRKTEAFFDFMYNCNNEFLEENLNKLILLSTQYKIYKFSIFAYHLISLFYIKNDNLILASTMFNKILNLMNNEGYKDNISVETWFLCNDIKTFYLKHSSECIKLKNSYKLTALERRLEYLDFPKVDDSLFYDGEYSYGIP